MIRKPRIILFRFRLETESRLKLADPSGLSARRNAKLRAVDLRAAAAGSKSVQVQRVKQIEEIKSQIQFCRLSEETETCQAKILCNRQIS